MVDEKKVCARNKCVEGDIRKFGKVTFNLGHKSCDYCHEARNVNRNGMARRRYKCPDKSVYCFTHNDEIVYIGSSDITPFRINEHYLGHRSFKERSNYNKLEFQMKYRWKILYSGDDYAHQEKVLIYKHKPKFNRIQYVKYNEEINNQKSVSNWRSALSIRFGRLLGFLQRLTKNI